MPQMTPDVRHLSGLCDICLWVLHRTSPSRDGLRLLLLASSVGHSYTLIYPLIIDGNGAIASPDEDDLVVVNAPIHEIHPHVERFAASFGPNVFRPQGPYPIDLVDLVRLGPATIIQALRQACVELGAHDRLNPVGSYEAITPKERLVAVGRQAPVEDYVELELHSGPPDPNGPLGLVFVRSMMPKAEAEALLLLIEALRLFGYLETWRPLGHYRLEGPLGQIVALPQVS